MLRLWREHELAEAAGRGKTAKRATKQLGNCKGRKKTGIVVQRGAASKAPPPGPDVQHFAGMALLVCLLQPVQQRDTRLTSSPVRCLCLYQTPCAAHPPPHSTARLVGGAAGAGDGWHGAAGEGEGRQAAGDKGRVRGMGSSRTHNTLHVAAKCNRRRPMTDR